MNLRLIAPDAAYEQSYRGYLNEINKIEEDPIPFVLEFSFDSFKDLLEQLENCSKGIGLREGFVPHSTFWLVDTEAFEVIGVANLRHRLTPALLEAGGHIGYGIRPSRRGQGYGTMILRESLNKLRELDITKVLVTCANDNTASERVILANGGVFESESYVEREGETLRRFWIHGT